MDFAKFATNYSIIFAVFGALFCLLIAPFNGVYWSHWLIGGAIHALFAAELVAIGLFLDGHRPRGARNTFHGATLIISAPLAVATIAFLPLMHWPMIAWLLPGILILFIWMVAWFAAVEEDDDFQVRTTKQDHVDRGRCYYRHCAEPSWYAIATTDKNGREVWFDLCFGHNLELQSVCEVKIGERDLYDSMFNTQLDVYAAMRWIRRWIFHDCEEQECGYRV